MPNRAFYGAITDINDVVRKAFAGFRHLIGGVAFRGLLSFFTLLWL